jgi:peptidoglycan hydrolase-like protein with peptidoglycan-binding domain
MFLARHVEDPAGPITWNGTRWRLLDRVAAAAPPGRSMHEIGLAADMVGDMAWLKDNCARFGLQTFEAVNGEPWHVQPVELPRARGDYESQGSAWGAPGAYQVPNATSPAGGGPSAAPPPGVPSMTPAFQVVHGTTGAPVRILLEALIAHGKLADTPQSRHDTYTDDDLSLVLAFQREGGLVVDGVVGPQTWGSLLSVIEPGASGPAVRALQHTLIARGLIRDNSSNLDGSYGPITQQRIRDFQSVTGLDGTGQVESRTWTALLGQRKQVGVSRGDDSSDLDLDDLDVLSVISDNPAE